MVTDARDRALLASAVQVADGVLRQDSRYVQELTVWAPPPLSLRPDGVPSSAYCGQPEHTDPDFPGRDFAHGHQWGSPRFGSATAYHAAGVGLVLCTTRDQRTDWVNAGQALQRLLLTSTAVGVAGALHSQPIEVAEVRELLRTQVCGGAHPQAVLRLGTVIQTTSSVRRPAADVLRFAPDGAAEPDPVAGTDLIPTRT